MATYGKISSSLLNFNPTTTPIDNPLALSLGQAVAQRNAPNLNLGLFQSTPYVLTPQRTSSANPVNTEYSNTSFGNNITIVTPNTKPSQPNNADPGLRVPRYGGSIMDKARGMHGSIIIGHDIATIGFAAGTSENSARDGYPEGVNFNAPSVILGSNILEGVGTADYGAGYGGGHFSSNVIMGVGFGSALVNGNLDYLQGGYGYGSIVYGRSNTVMGNNNYAYSLRTTENGYSAGISSNTIVGQDNGVAERFDSAKGYFVGYKSPVITARANGNGVYETCFRRSVNNNTILGSENFALRFGWFGANKMTNPYFSPRVDEGQNIIIGQKNNSSLSGYPLKNFDYDGSDISQRRVSFGGNTIIGERNVLMKEYFSAGYSEGSAQNTIIGNYNVFSAGGDNNIIIGDRWRWAQDNEHRIDTDKNIFIGNLSTANGEKFWGPQGTGTPGQTTTTQNNTMIGSELEVGLTQNRINHENVTVIGYQATTSSPTVNNEITLGNSSISALRCNVTSITSLSDARDKANIEPISNASAFIKDLKPVKFDWNRRDGVKAKEHDIGFLAQDLDEAQSKHGIQEHLDIVYKSNPEALEASYGKLLPILVQALKEQQEEIEKLKSTN